MRIYSNEMNANLKAALKESEIIAAGEEAHTVRDSDTINKMAEVKILSST
jgi:hypothetical protein